MPEKAPTEFNHITYIDALYKALTFNAPQEVQSFASVVNWVDEHVEEFPIWAQLARSAQVQQVLGRPRVLVIGEFHGAFVWNMLSCDCSSFYTLYIDTLKTSDYERNG